MKEPIPLPNKLTNAAFYEQQRAAITAPVWEIARELIRGAPPLCLRKHPLVRRVIYHAAQLTRRDKKVNLGYISFHISMSVILIGLLGGTLCGCDYCTKENFEDPNGTWLY